MALCIFCGQKIWKQRISTKNAAQWAPAPLNTWTTIEQRGVVRFLWAKNMKAKDIDKEMLPNAWAAFLSKNAVYLFVVEHVRTLKNVSFAATKIPVCTAIKLVCKTLIQSVRQSQYTGVIKYNSLQTAKSLRVPNAVCQERVSGPEM
jgi:hypothetical protein